MHKLVFPIILLVCSSWASAQLGTRAVSSYLGSGDVQRLQNVFGDGLASSDLQAIYFATLNIQPTNANEKTQVCSKLVSLHESSKLNAFEKDFYLIGVHKNLGCSEKLPEPVATKVRAAFKEPLASCQEIYYRIASQKLLGVQLTETSTANIVKNLKDLLKKDDTLVTLGYAFNVAPELGQSAAFIAERVEDAIVQADEVDGRMLQFEGGLSITGLVVNGAFKVSKTFNKPSPINAEQAVKLTNYFLSRRSVQTAKGAHILIEALRTLAASGKVAPIAIQVIGNGQLQADAPLSIAVVDVLGKALPAAPQAIFGKVVLKKDNTVLAEKVKFVSQSSDKTTFVADLNAYKPTRGIYVADVVVDGVHKQRVQFKVLGRVKVHSLDLSVADADGSSTARKESVEYPKTLKEVLSADTTQKLLVKAVLVDEGTTKVITVHQAFVRLYNKESDQEIIFIAEQDSSKAYKFDMDVNSNGANFGYKSGKYEVYLTIGDASLSNSFDWHVATIDLKFAQEPNASAKQAIRSPLPEIVHQFRPPEKRPPRIVSDVFTVLCVAPLVLLLLFWGKLGINVSNFSFAPSTLGFHIGLGGILALFGIFWLQLNMFQTLRLLIPIAVFTFLCGNRLLRRLYAQRTSKPGAASS